MQAHQTLQKKIWFRAKYYGWGWYPVSWQGWLAVLFYVSMLILLILLLQKNIYTLGLPQNSRDVPWQLFFKHLIVPEIILTALLLALCYKKGEKPRWRWGKDI